MKRLAFSAIAGIAVVAALAPGALAGGGTGDCSTHYGYKCPKPPVAVALTASKTATPSFKRTYKWKVAKSVDPAKRTVADGAAASFSYSVVVSHDSGADSDWKVTGTISVTNTNDGAVKGVDIVDAVIDLRAHCSITGGTNATIPANSTKSFAYTCTYSGAPFTMHEWNVALVKWCDQKLSDGSMLDGGFAVAKAPVDWTSPTLVDGSVAVSDSLAGSLGTVSAGDPSPKTITYSRSFTDPGGTCTTHDNTATITASTSGTTASDSKTVQVCVGKNLSVSKTATPAFARSYTWDIGKSVDRTTAAGAGGNATFNYTVVAKQLGFTDSGWQVTGKITVSNPNDWESIDADVSDAVDNGGACTIAGSSHVTLAPSASATLDYTCSYASAPTAAAGTNTATATWNASQASTPAGTASGNASFAFTSPTSRTNATVTVTDTFNGGTTTLGTLTATDAAPFATATYSYSRSVPFPASGCTSYPNTAQIVETGQSASQSVSACGPQGITLAVTCIDRQADGTWDAHFEYTNPNAFAVTVPLGPDNLLIPPNTFNSHVLPTVFQPGTKTNALFVSNIPRDVSLTWSLTVGGVTNSATGMRSSTPLCPR